LLNDIDRDEHGAQEKGYATHVKRIAASVACLLVGTQI